MIFYITIILFSKIGGLINWLEDHMLACPSKALSGVDCPGCGMQRAIIHLLKGEFGEAFIIYAPIYALVITFLLLVGHLFINSNSTRVALKYAYILSALVIVLNFIAKLIV